MTETIYAFKYQKKSYEKAKKKKRIKEIQLCKKKGITKIQLQILTENLTDN